MRLRRIRKFLGSDELVPWTMPGDPKKVEAWETETRATMVADLEAVLFSEDFKDKLAAVVDDLHGLAIHEDLAKGLVAMLVEGSDDAEIISKFSGWISPEHEELLHLAVAYHNLNAWGLHADAQGLKESAAHVYGEDARRIMNLYSSGYIRDHFLWHRNWCEYEYQARPKKMFREWFERQLAYFDKAIFVSDTMEPKKLQIELHSRLLTDLAPPRRRVAVWTGNEATIIMAEKVLNRWVGDHPGFDYAVELAKNPNHPTAVFLVFEKKKNAKLRPSRLEMYWWKNLG